MCQVLITGHFQGRHYLNAHNCIFLVFSCQLLMTKVLHLTHCSYGIQHNCLSCIGRNKVRRETCYLSLLQSAKASPPVHFTALCLPVLQAACDSPVTAHVHSNINCFQVAICLILQSPLRFFFLIHNWLYHFLRGFSLVSKKPKTIIRTGGNNKKSQGCQI